MEIRLAQASDIPSILNLLQQVEQVHHRIRPDIFVHAGQKYNAEALKALLADPNMPIFAALEEETLLGYCFCQLRHYESAMFRPRSELYIDDLCVDEACRSTGVGTALYRHALSYAKAQGCNFISLNVWCGNDSAMAFYKSKGLKPRNILMEYPLEDK